MNGIDPDQLVRHLKWRYATRLFDPAQKISVRDWQALEQVMILSPSSFGLQPWKFVVVTDPAVKASLVTLTRNQIQPRDCSHFVAICVRREIDPEFVESYITSIAQQRAVPIETLAGYRGSILTSAQKTRGHHEHWNARQAYIVLGFLLEAAALLGIDACPMEGFDVPGYNDALKLTDRGFTAVVACALGYRLPTDSHAARAKVRFKASDVVEHI